MAKAKIIVGDYSADNSKSWLAELEALSLKRGDGGMLHSGIIHYIQGKFGGDEGFCLKAAIKFVLEAVPGIIPRNFGELIKKPEWQPTKDQQAWHDDMNQHLLIPISGGEIAEIIRLGEEYEQLPLHLAGTVAEREKGKES